MKKRANESERDRKKDKRLTTMKNKGVQLVEANILVVMAKTSNFTFKMPMDPAGGCKEKDDMDTLPRRFKQWMEKGENNYDALLLSAAGKGRPLFQFQRNKRNSNNDEAVLQGVIGPWAFRLRERLSMSGEWKEKKSTMRFTTSTTFYDNVKNRPEEQAEIIAKNYQYVIMADEHRVGKTGKEGHEEILDYCAAHLIKRQVSIFPPLSLMYALSDKHRLRDPMLEEIMLPHVRLPAKETISESAEEAKMALEIVCPERNLDHMVAKVNTSCSAMGVFFVEKKKGEEGKWKTIKDGKQVSDKIGRNKGGGIEIGEVLRWEPYLEVLQKEEWRMYKYMITNSTKSGMKSLYAAETRLEDNGKIHVRRTATQEVRGKNEDQKRNMNGLCRRTIDLLRKSQHSAWRGIQDLVFRFDMVVDGNEVYLNEIDVFPLAVSFLDEYIASQDIIETMADCTYRYMISHTTEGVAWPM
jgi:hypothetical protein